jgi:hypothetical protein
VHVPLTHEQQKLLLREVGIDESESNGMKRQIPRCVPAQGSLLLPHRSSSCKVMHLISSHIYDLPGVLPLVGYRYDVAIKEMCPVVVPASQTRGRRGRHLGVALQPVLDDVVVELFRPQETREGLREVR